MALARVVVVVVVAASRMANAAPAKEVSIDVVGPDVIEVTPTDLAVEADAVVDRTAPGATTDAAMGVASGATIDDESFPDVVLVGGDAGFYCSGVLIDERHVLTAAHCAAATRVGFGHTAKVAVHVRITATARHPRLDVAVFTLARAAKLRTHARRTHRDTTPPLGQIRVMGFGVEDRLRLTGFGTKRQVDVDVDGWGCTRTRSAQLGCVMEDELLVRGGRGNDTCLGDSGGPVFERVEDGWRLLAVTSRGMKPRKVICGEGGIYVRVDRIDNWLEEVTR